MIYPPPPWNLKGYAMVGFHFVDIEQAKNFVPQELEIISALPGKTLASIYFSSYSTDSVLEYNELIVTPAFIRHENKIGGWISHIYVDNEQSVAGGREIWGLPKEMAEFTWGKNTVSVRQNNMELCNFQFQKAFLGLSTFWSLGLVASAFGGLNSELLFFRNKFNSPIGMLSSNLEVPQSSPFVNIKLGQPWLTLNLPQLNLLAGKPEVVGNKALNLGKLSS